MGKKYGCIIIGGGLSGLSAGLCWALHADAARLPVIIIEKQPKTGGFVTTFKRRGYTIDTCQLFPDISDILNHFSVTIPLHRFDGEMIRYFFVAPGRGEQLRTFSLPANYEDFIRVIAARSPGSPAEEFLRRSGNLYRELIALKVKPGIIDILSILLSHPAVIRASGKTWARYCDAAGITDPEIREILHAFVEMSALPEHEIAACVPVVIMHSLLEGVYRPINGFIDLPRALEERFRSLNGEIMLHTGVAAILEHHGKVCGVRLTNGETLDADTVISTADTKATMLELVGLEKLHSLDTRYARKAETVEMSMSTFVVSLCLDDEFDPVEYRLNVAFHILSTGMNAFKILYDACRRGDDLFSPELFHISISCPPPAPGNKTCLTLGTYPVAIEPWKSMREKDRAQYKREKERRCDIVVGIVEKYLIPEIRRHIVLTDIATPATFARYSGSPAGSIYDMVSPPGNFANARLSMRTPVRGLYSPKFVHGIAGALLSGMQAADAILAGAVMNGKLRPGKKRRIDG